MCSCMAGDVRQQQAHNCSVHDQLQCITPNESQAAFRRQYGEAHAADCLTLSVTGNTKKPQKRPLNSKLFIRGLADLWHIFYKLLSRGFLYDPVQNKYISIQTSCCHRCVKLVKQLNRASLHSITCHHLCNQCTTIHTGQKQCLSMVHTIIKNNLSRNEGLLSENQSAYAGPVAQNLAMHAASSLTTCVFCSDANNIRKLLNRQSAVGGSSVMPLDIFKPCWDWQKRLACLQSCAGALNSCALRTAHTPTQTCMPLGTASKPQLRDRP